MVFNLEKEMKEVQKKLEELTYKVASDCHEGHMKSFEPSVSITVYSDDEGFHFTLEVYSYTLDLTEDGGRNHYYFGNDLETLFKKLKEDIKKVEKEYEKCMETGEGKWEY